MSKSKIFIMSEEAAPTKINILEETSNPGSGYKVTFRAKLQTANVPNNNKRIYPTETLAEVYRQLKPKIESGKLLGELDHPQVQTSDQNGQIKRSSTILLQNSCVHFKEIDWNGESISAIVSTTTNRAGMDAYALIKDNVTVGFSLRAFGELEKDGTFDKVPVRGMKAITYDFVSMPSHGDAVIMEFLNESTNINELVKDLKNYEKALINVAETKKMNIIEESDISFVNNNGQICANGICQLKPIEETIDYLMNIAVKNPKFKKIRVKF